MYQYSLTTQSDCENIRQATKRLKGSLKPVAPALLVQNWIWDEVTPKGGQESPHSFPISTTQKQGQIHATTRSPIREPPEPSIAHKAETFLPPPAREAEINIPAATQDPQTALTKIRVAPSPASWTWASHRACWKTWLLPPVPPPPPLIRSTRPHYLHKGRRCIW